MAKYAAYGTKLYRGTSGGGTLYANVMDISGPGLTADTEDVTSHDSSGAWEEHVVTILRSGEVTMGIAYDPANATHKYAASGLLYDFASRASTTFTLKFPNVAATEWVFTAFVTGFNPSAPVAGALTADVTFKLTGAPTLA